MVDDQEVLRRYLLVLHLLRKAAIPRDGALWENALLLVKLRNAFVHYKSRWGREMEATKLYAALTKLQLARPPFVSANAVFFPHQCLSAECAAWAVDTSFQFLKEFYARLGFPNPLLHVEPKLAALLKSPA